jgi:hypothetical protein
VTAAQSQPIMREARPNNPDGTSCARTLCEAPSDSTRAREHVIERVTRPDAQQGEDPPAHRGRLSPRSPGRADLSRLSHRLTGRHRTRADSLDIEPTLTCSYGFCRTDRTGSIDLRI